MQASASQVARGSLQSGQQPATIPEDAPAEQLPDELGSPGPLLKVESATAASPSAGLRSGGAPQSAPTAPPTAAAGRAASDREAASDGITASDRRDAVRGQTDPEVSVCMPILECTT